MQTKATELISTAKSLLLAIVLASIVANGYATEPDTLPSAEASMAEFCKGLPRAEYKTLEKLESDDDWFELYRVAPGVTAIYEPHQWQEVISYLIEGNDQALLFDTGNGIGDIQKVVAGLTTKPISVLNSHSHYDHVGGNYSFSKIYGLDTAFTRDRQSGHENDAIAIEVSAQALCQRLPNGVTPQNHIGRPFKVSNIVKEGSKIELGDRTLEVIHIPGHTPDAIALIDREARLMWTGDSFYAGPIWLFAQETDLSLYRSSLKRMIKELPNIDWLLPAHNTPWVKASILPHVLTAFDKMLAGEADTIGQGDGMVKHEIPGESRFSFLMRDEDLPYRK